MCLRAPLSDSPKIGVLGISHIQTSANFPKLHKKAIVGNQKTNQIPL